MSERGWFKTVAGPWVVRLLGTEYPQRAALELVTGDNVEIDVEDVPADGITKITIGAPGAGGTVATTNGSAPQAGAEVTTSNATPTQIGATFPIALDTLTTVAIEVQCIQAGATKGKVFSVRRTFLNDGGTITSGTQQDLITPEELGGSLATSVAITRTGAVGRFEVTGIAGVGLRWYLISQTMKVGAAAAAAAPTVTSITPTTGGTGGGTAVTIAGTNFVSGATVTIGGVPCTSVVFVGSTQLTAVSPPGTAGAKAVVVTNPDAQTGTLAGGFTFVAAAYDPATAPRALWVRGSYAGLPWDGVASVGTSGAHDLAAIDGVPATGAAVNGYTPADFDGVDDYCGYATAADLLSVGAGTIEALFYADAADAPTVGAPFQSPGFMLNNGAACCLVYDTDGAKIGIYDGAWKSAAASAPTGSWHLVQATWDGTTARVRVDGGAWQTVAAGAADNMSGTAFVGRAYTSGLRFNGKVMEISMSPTKLSDAHLDGYLDYCATRYPAMGL